MVCGLPPSLIYLVPRNSVARLYQVLRYRIAHITESNNANGFTWIHKLTVLLVNRGSQGISMGERAVFPL